MFGQHTPSTTRRGRNLRSISRIFVEMMFKTINKCTSCSNGLTKQLTEDSSSGVVGQLWDALWGACGLQPSETLSYRKRLRRVIAAPLTNSSCNLRVLCEHLHLPMARQVEFKARTIAMTFAMTSACQAKYAESAPERHAKK